MTDIEHEAAPAIAPRRAPRFRVLGANRIAVRWGSSTELIVWSEIVSVHSVRNYSVISVCDRTLKVRGSLRAVVAELAALGLMQVRRDAAVNVTRVRRLIGAGRHRLLMILDDDRRIEVGREFQRQVRTRLGQYVDSDESRRLNHARDQTWVRAASSPPATLRISTPQRSPL